VSRPLTLLVNPAASGGRALQVVPEVLEELGRLGAEPRVVQTVSLEHSLEEAHRASSEAGVVIAVSGDGLVGRLAGALMDTDAALAMIPAGRGNDFARVLGVPKSPREAARVALEGTERMVDVGQAGGVSFLGIASVGFDSDVQDIANAARLVRGNLVYLYATLRGMAAWRHATFTVDLDGEEHSVHGFSVAVANSGMFGGGMHLVPGAALDDGRLDIVLTAKEGKLRCLRNLPKLFKGTHVDLPWLTFLAGERVEVGADRPFTVYADGDPIGNLPMSFRVRRQALRVMVP